MTKTQIRNVVIALFLLGLLLPFTSNAQYFRGSRFWKQYRKELTFGIGTSQVLTDLGGRDQIGTDFIYDMELKKTRYAITAGYRYFLKEKVSISGNLTYAMLQGDDALTQETFRNNRNLNFHTPLVEAAFLGEYHLTNTDPGHRYKLKGARGKKSFAFGTYLFGGIGLFYFDPRANDGTRLRPLHTEGQGQDPITVTTGATTIQTYQLQAPKQYKPINVSFPIGLGINYGLDVKWSVGLRAGWRFTTTDYLDDVSGVYWSKTDLATIDSRSVKYSDPSKSYATGLAEDNQDLKNWTEVGQQRGDNTDKDNYGFLQITVNYKLVEKKQYGRSRRIKTRRSMPSF